MLQHSTTLKHEEQVLCGIFYLLLYNNIKEYERSFLYEGAFFMGRQWFEICQTLYIAQDRWQATGAAQPTLSEPSL